MEKMKSLLSMLWLPVFGVACLIGLYFFRVEAQKRMTSDLNRVCENLSQEPPRAAIFGVTSSEIKTMVLAAQQTTPERKTEVFLRGAKELGYTDWTCPHLDRL